MQHRRLEHVRKAPQHMRADRSEFVRADFELGAELADRTAEVV